MVSVQPGLSLDQTPQLIEHAGHIPRHADLIGLGMISLSPRLLRFCLRCVTLLDQPGLIGFHPLHQRLQQVLHLGPLLTVLAILAVGILAGPLELIADPLQLGGMEP
jgi:hypothetical protein